MSLFFKDHFIGYRLCSFQHLKNVLPFPLAPMVYNEISAIIWINVPLIGNMLFLYSYFQEFFCVFSFQNSVMYVGMDFLGIILVGFALCLGTVSLCLLPNFGNFQISSNTHLDPFSSSPSGTLIIRMLGFGLLYYRSLRLCSFFPLVYFLSIVYVE